MVSRAPVVKTRIQPAPVDQLGRKMRDLRISVIDRCNFRCPYCMPEDEFPEHHQFFTPDERLTIDEIVLLSEVFSGLGVQKIRITGGEPLLRKNLASLISRLNDIRGIDEIAITTNGFLLDRHAEALQESGLDRVTVSLDSLDPDLFARMSGGRGSLVQVLSGIESADAVGLPLKINAVIQRGLNDHSVIDLVDRFRGTGHIVRFIEYMDVGNRNHWHMAEVVSSAELLEQIGEHWPLEPLDENYQGEVARRFRFVDGGGEIGFISSLSQPFCGSCTRARLSTNGVLYTCLFASHGTDLRGPMRDGADHEELTDIVRSVWLERGDRYSELRVPSQAEEHPIHKVEMYQVGG